MSLFPTHSVGSLSHRGRLAAVVVVCLAVFLQALPAYGCGPALVRVVARTFNDCENQSTPDEERTQSETAPSSSALMVAQRAQPRLARTPAGRVIVCCSLAPRRPWADVGPQKLRDELAGRNGCGAFLRC